MNDLTAKIIFNNAPIAADTLANLKHVNVISINGNYMIVKGTLSDIDSFANSCAEVKHWIVQSDLPNSSWIPTGKVCNGRV